MLIDKIYLSPECIGTGIELVGVSPDMYDKSVKQKEPVGYKYEVLLKEHRWDRLTVRIPGKQLMDEPLSGTSVPVIFDNLRVRPYVARGTNKLAFTASADSIRPVQSTADNTKR